MNSGLRKEKSWKSCGSILMMTTSSVGVRLVAEVVNWGSKLETSF